MYITDTTAVIRIGDGIRICDRSAETSCAGAVL
jgi:hypothetical protein